MIDITAGQVVSYWYNDFGEVAEENGSNYGNFLNEIQYTGAIYDSVTSLLYLNARFYDPSTGRFISQDTYRGEYEEPNTWHLYAYCSNDPVNYIDSFGNERKSSNTKRGDRKGAKAQTPKMLGYGIQVVIATTIVFDHILFGEDFVWFTKKVSKRFKGKKFHFYTTKIGSGGNLKGL